MKVAKTSTILSLCHYHCYSYLLVSHSLQCLGNNLYDLFDDIALAISRNVLYIKHVYWESHPQRSLLILTWIFGSYNVPNRLGMRSATYVGIGSIKADHLCCQQRKLMYVSDPPSTYPHLANLTRSLCWPSSNTHLTYIWTKSKNN